MTTASEWQAQLGKVWASNAALTDRAFSGLTQRLLERLARIPGDQILDIGAGAGELSLALARARPAASVTGVDISEDLVEVARYRGLNLPNLTFILADAAGWTVERAPDLLVSRHGVMFFDDPVAAFANLRRQSAPGAQMVFSCFRDNFLNPWSTEPLEVIGQPQPVEPGAPGPFAFADEQHVRSILAKSGWRHVSMEPVDFAFITGMGEHSAQEALQFFTRIGPTAKAVREMEDDARQEVLARLERWIARGVDRGLAAFPAAAWIVAAHRD